MSHYLNHYLNIKQDFNAGIGLAAMLGRANYIAIVGGGRQPKFSQNKVSVNGILFGAKIGSTYHILNR